jgi:hypothetical protein
MHCIERPFGKAIDGNFIFHPGKRPDQTEDKLARGLRLWTRIMVAATCADVYRYCMQMKTNQAQPAGDWDQVRANYEALPVKN